MAIGYPHDYEYGALNPWPSPSDTGLDSTSTPPGYLSAPFLQGVVLYAWKEEVEPNTFSSADPLNTRKTKYETVFVYVRIPELHNVPVPRSLPANNSREDRAADWDSIVRHPRFQALDIAVAQKPIPQPGDIVKVDYRDRRTRTGPIYLGPIRESVRATPTVTTSKSLREAFSKPAGNNPTLGHANQNLTSQAAAIAPADSLIMDPQEFEHTRLNIIRHYIRPDKETDYSVSRSNLRNLGNKRVSMPSGGRYPAGLRHPATNIVIHEPGTTVTSKNNGYYGPKRLNTILSAKGLGVHYSISGADCNESERVCAPGLKDIYEHIDPAKYYKSHATPFNEISVGIEILRPTYADKKFEADGETYFKVPRWWAWTSKTLYLPPWNDFEPLFKLIRYLLSPQMGLHVPLQFPAVRIAGVNMNERDHTNAVPMTSYTHAWFQWGAPFCDGLDFNHVRPKPDPKKKRWYLKQIPESPDGHRRQAPDAIIARGKPKYPQMNKDGTSNRLKEGQPGRGYWVPSDSVNYSRGIMAHARWHHSDALPSEYYCLMRFMGYNPDESYKLTKEAIRSLDNKTNITRLPPFKIN